MIKITKNEIIGSPTKADAKTKKISSILPQDFFLINWDTKNWFWDFLTFTTEVPSCYQCFNQWQHSSAILIAALYCDGPPLWLVEKTVDGRNSWCTFVRQYAGRKPHGLCLKSSLRTILVFHRLNSWSAQQSWLEIKHT